ncbi:VRR-NUC domain-containing protein [Candidatus Atribacteria bacterium 1244-E10-H5-B2]|nr:MAG: VRR-NUC domain-containing protein [Candidatus Atribacteria bacterium 1244-E10-H5-B2]
MKKYKLKFKISENDIKHQVKSYLNIKGWFNFHILQGLGAFRGIPDMIAVKAGRVIFLEIKKPGGKLSEHQQRFKETMGGAGGEYYVVRSLEEIIKILEV